MKQLKEGDPIIYRDYYGVVSKVIEQDGYTAYTFSGPCGEYTLYGGELLTKKKAQELIKDMNDRIKFLKNI